MSALLSLTFAYAAAGIATGVAFALGLAPRLLPDAPQVSVGARLVLAPGAFLLWPLVVRRWLKGPRQ